MEENKKVSVTFVLFTDEVKSRLLSLITKLNCARSGGYQDASREHSMPDLFTCVDICVSSLLHDLEAIKRERNNLLFRLNEYKDEGNG